MKRSDVRADVSSSLDRAEETLASILGTLGDLEPALLAIELGLSASNRLSNSSFLYGTSEGVVCIASGLIKGEPLGEAMEAIRGSGVRMPPLVLGSDRSEGQGSCSDIVRTIRTRVICPRFIIMLRAAGQEIPVKRAVFIGTRYMRGEEETLHKLEGGIREIGAVVTRDYGEFGGGTLAYSLIGAFRKDESETVLELTLSNDLIDDRKWLANLLYFLCEI